MYVVQGSRQCVEMMAVAKSAPEYFMQSMKIMFFLRLSLCSTMLIYSVKKTTVKQRSTYHKANCVLKYDNFVSEETFNKYSRDTARK